jgi:hypothetical protein
VRRPESTISTSLQQTWTPSSNGVTTFSYIHSVEKTWVQGIFTVDPDDRLLLLETRMESVGTGLPIEAEECVGREGGWRVAGRQPMVLPELRFRYHRINELRLEYNGKQVPVDDTRENELATLQVEKIRLGTYLLYRLSSLFDA